MYDCALPAAPAREAAPGVTVSTAITLDAPVSVVWREIQRPALLLHITRGLMRFEPVEPGGFPDTWAVRDYTARLYAYGVVPIGKQVIGIERPPPCGDRRFLRDNGRGDMCRKWDHLMTMHPLPGGRTRYIDAVTVEAGWNTLPIAAFAYTYYALRQRRLRRASRRGFAY